MSLGWLVVTASTVIGTPPSSDRASSGVLPTTTVGTVTSSLPFEITRVILWLCGTRAPAVGWVPMIMSLATVLLNWVTVVLETSKPAFLRAVVAADWFWPVSAGTWPKRPEPYHQLA